MIISAVILKVAAIFDNFCCNFKSCCGDRLQENVTEREASVDELIQGYFHRGYPYQVIVGLLEKQDGVRMHVRTLKRKLKDLGLKRKAANHDEEIVRRELIKQEMQGAGSLAGYRYRISLQFLSRFVPKVL